MKGKGKVKMDAIEDASDRRTTYRKRKGTLMKKMDEITTLCGVEGGMIIYSEFEEGNGLQTWLASAQAVQGVVERFKSVSDADMGKKKSVDMDGWVESRLEKERLRLMKARMGNEDIEARMLMSDCFAGRYVDGLPVNGLSRVGYQVDEGLRTVSSRKMELNNTQAGVEDPNMYLNLDYPVFGMEGQAGPSGTRRR